MAISPSKKLTATMRGSYSTNNLNEFLSDLMIGKGGLTSLPGEMQLKKAEKWDGKDAPPLEEDDMYYEDL